jgi:hypothetical protein
MAACPYAQRTRILLQVKGINSDLVEIDLSKPRPQWFLEINPAGKGESLPIGDATATIMPINREAESRAVPRRPPRERRWVRGDGLT